MQKGKKFVTFALISTIMELLWSYIKKVSTSTGMVDEKVTVISSVVHTHTYIPRPSWKLRWDQCYFFCY